MVRLDPERKAQADKEALQIKDNILAFLDMPMTEENFKKLQSIVAAEAFIDWIMYNSYTGGSSDRAHADLLAVNDFDLFNRKEVILAQDKRDIETNGRPTNLPLRVRTGAQYLGNIYAHIRTGTLSVEDAEAGLRLAAELTSYYRYIVTQWIVQACPAIKDKIEQEV